MEMLANVEIPKEVIYSIKLGALPLLNKLDENAVVIGYRGICTGDLCRRVVAKTLVSQHMSEFAEATAPHQVALGTRAAVDSAVLAARAALDLDPELVLLSIDGIGAYDHVLRGEFLGRLDEIPNARNILPFIKMFYGSQSSYLVRDQDGHSVEVLQGGGGRTR